MSDLTTTEREILCPRCVVWRPESHFAKCKSRSTGRQGYCRKCQAAYQRGREEARMSELLRRIAELEGHVARLRDLVEGPR